MQLKFTSQHNSFLRNFIMTNFGLGIFSLVFGSNHQITVLYLFSAFIMLLQIKTQIIIDDKNITLGMEGFKNNKIGFLTLFNQTAIKIQDIVSIEVEVSHKRFNRSDQYFFTTYNGLMIIKDKSENLLELKNWMFSSYQFREILNTLLYKNQKILIDEGTQTILSSSDENIPKKPLEIEEVFQYSIHFLAMIFIILDLVNTFL